MKPTPKDWPRISSSLFYAEPAKAIDWLCAAFGFAVRLKVEGDGGMIVHSELTFGDGVVMVSGSGAVSGKPDSDYQKTPGELAGANTQSLFVYVDDVEAHCSHARAAGAVIVKEPMTSDYGDDYWVDRGYQARDVEGHNWYFAQRLSGAKQ
jgi:uncharacterized glyoxalase superfamily protein PhnB